MKTRRADIKARHARIRKKIKGTGARPRLFVFRSARHIYAQIIDDNKAQTLVSASTMDAGFTQKMKSTGNVTAAKLVGSILAERALTKGIKEVIFDRGGFMYHGRIKALAEAAREVGLEF